MGLGTRAQIPPLDVRLPIQGRSQPQKKQSLHFTTFCLHSMPLHSSRGPSESCTKSIWWRLGWSYHGNRRGLARRHNSLMEVSKDHGNCRLAPVFQAESTLSKRHRSEKGLQPALRVSSGCAHPPPCPVGHTAGHRRALRAHEARQLTRPCIRAANPPQVSSPKSEERMSVRVFLQLP